MFPPQSIVNVGFGLNLEHIFDSKFFDNYHTFQSPLHHPERVQDLNSLDVIRQELSKLNFDDPNVIESFTSEDVFCCRIDPDQPHLGPTVGLFIPNISPIVSTKSPQFFSEGFAYRRLAQTINTGILLENPDIQELLLAPHWQTGALAKYLAFTDQSRAPEKRFYNFKQIQIKEAPRYGRH